MLKCKCKVRLHSVTRASLKLSVFSILAVCFFRRKKVEVLWSSRHVRCFRRFRCCGGGGSRRPCAKTLGKDLLNDSL